MVRKPSGERAGLDHEDAVVRPSSQRPVASGELITEDEEGHSVRPPAMASMKSLRDASH
jgi:hypothetical protein